MELIRLLLMPITVPIMALTVGPILILIALFS